MVCQKFRFYQNFFKISPGQNRTTGYLEDRTERAALPRATPQSGPRSETFTAGPAGPERAIESEHLIYCAVSAADVLRPKFKWMNARLRIGRVGVRIPPGVLLDIVKMNGRRGSEDPHLHPGREWIARWSPKPEVPGSSPGGCTVLGEAEVEQRRTVNAEVAGSIPVTQPMAPRSRWKWTPGCRPGDHGFESRRGRSRRSARCTSSGVLSHHNLKPVPPDAAAAREPERSRSLGPVWSGRLAVSREITGSSPVGIASWTPPRSQLRARSVGLLCSPPNRAQSGRSAGRRRPNLSTSVAQAEHPALHRKGVGS